MKILTKVKDGFYDLSVKLFGRKKQNEKPTKPSTLKRNETIFLITLLIFPVLQFIIFYFGININSLMLAFKTYQNGELVWSGFGEFVKIFDMVFGAEGELVLAIKNSLIQFGLALIGIPLHIAVAYCIFKKVPLSGFYKVMVFLPQVISSMVFVLCGEYIIKNLVPSLFPTLEGVNDLLISSSNYSFPTILLFGFWMGFAGGLVIYLSSMSSISVDIIEYGKLEKMNSLQELWYIVVPSIFPTIVTYVVVAFAGFFTNYGYFFAFFGDGGSTPKFTTLGYEFFVKIVGNGKMDTNKMMYYPYAAAGGIIFTAVCAPITITVKYLMEKFGPSEE